MYQRLLKSLNHLNPRAWDFIQLTRMDKPIGIYLLLWPTLWALWIAGKGSPSLLNIVIFVLGVVLTRAGGCVINDWADRKVDGFTAETGSLPAIAWLLYIANLLWTVGYDTYYAMTDRDDDLKIGVKSTAILFGEADRVIILTLQGLSLGCLLLAGARPFFPHRSCRPPSCP